MTYRTPLSPHITIIDKADRIYSIAFTIWPTKTAKHQVLHLANMCCAMAERRGCLGSQTIEEIFESTESGFQVDEEWLDAPVFVARSSRSTWSDLPLTDEHARILLRDLLRQAGMNTGLGEEHQQEQYPRSS